MQISKYRLGRFVVLRVDEPVAVTDEVFELRALIETTAKTDCVNLALGFPPGSMLRSSAMTSIVLAAGYVRSCGGTLAMIDPSPSVRAVLDVLGVHDLIVTVRSEEELAAVEPSELTSS